MITGSKAAVEIVRLIAMIDCKYCGRLNDEQATGCSDCGTELPQLDQAKRALPSRQTGYKHIEPEAFKTGVSFEDGFHRVEWDVVRLWIESQLETLDWNMAWTEAATWWAGLLRDDLGGDYLVRQSRETILLCEQTEDISEWLLSYASRAATTIKEELGQTAWKGAFGKHLIIVFTDHDDYYQYVAHHMADGVNPSSGGMCIYSGYTHVALPWTEQLDVANAVIHELAHDCLAHLPLPHWLNEGVAVTLEKAIGAPPRPLGQSDQDAVYGAAINWRPPMMWDELAERHFTFWNEENIQTFWAGTSFYVPGDSNELSYSLAEVFVKLLSERGERRAFCGFLEASHREDTGHSASLGIFGTGLGEIAGTFLGKGEWRPQRKVIKACWEEAGWQSS